MAWWRLGLGRRGRRLRAGLLVAAATAGGSMVAITAIPITMTTDLMRTAMVILTDIVATQAIYPHRRHYYRYRYGGYYPYRGHYYR